MENIMPKKLLPIERVPTQVQERLRTWGSCIRQQRLRQGILAGELCRRMEISDASLRRLEKGDPGAGIGMFLTALHILGVLDEAAPELPETRWTGQERGRVRLPKMREGDVADF